MRLPLLSVVDGKTQKWTSTTIRALGKDEDYLEKLIGKAPALLGLEDLRTHVSGPYASFHQFAVETPSKRSVAPDIIFLTASGHVVVVEVKLGDNPELRDRRVIAQVVEYAASIASYSEEELTVLFDPSLSEGSKFSEVVRRHFPSPPEPVDLAHELVKRIQSAEIHLVIACDYAPEGIRELVASVSAQQALGNYEMRVAEIVPYVREGSADAGIILVPSGVTRTQVVSRTVVEVNGGVDGKPVEVTVKVTPQDEIEANITEALRHYLVSA